MSSPASPGPPLTPASRSTKRSTSPSPPSTSWSPPTTPSTTNTRDRATRVFKPHGRHVSVRTALLVAAALLLGGCFEGSGAKTLPAAEPSWFRLLTVDDEQMPIGNATIFFGQETTPRVSDAAGEVLVLNVSAGSFRIRAWAPS